MLRRTHSHQHCCESLTCVVTKLWHHRTSVGTVVVDVGARQAGIGQAGHVALGDVLRLWQEAWVMRETGTQHRAGQGRKGDNVGSGIKGLCDKGVNREGWSVAPGTQSLDDVIHAQELSAMIRALHLGLAVFLMQVVHAGHTPQE